MRHNTGMDMTEMVSQIFLIDSNRSALDSLYSTHPPTEERTRLLRAV